jgi:hypothetical protein
MTKVKILATCIGLLAAGAFLLLVLARPSGFNFIPFSIHERFFQTVSPDGEVYSSIEEATFIVIFDLISALVVFVLFYKGAKNYFT